MAETIWDSFITARQVSNILIVRNKRGMLAVLINPPLKQWRLACAFNTCYLINKKMNIQTHGNE